MLPWQRRFDRHVFAKLTLTQLFSPLLSFLHCFTDCEYFAVILGGFLAFWKNFEIQNGGSKMAAILTS